jgi:D-alanyl-lipoteichoic acid acyltransferase DltB (MBOAT superfamily)
VFADVPTFQLLLPVGISFYTFQSLSYVIDVYRGTTRVEKHLGIFALYVVFFPQLVAGPIERSDNLLPQFYRRHRVEYDRVRTGLQFVLWGLFKKMVVADLLAPAVETVYAHPQTFTGVPLVLATFFFAVQVYCDFSGYSDVAIGVARIMGFDLMTNFRQPYFAASVAGFWHRWHVSLSTWFRDYVYYPMGGSRVPTRVLWARNVMTVFIISGIWHGANWTFLLWGLLHGAYMLAERFTQPVRATLVAATGLARVPRVYHALKVAVVFCLVLAAWVLFRAKNVSDAAYVLTHAHRVGGFRVANLFALGLPRFEVVLAFVVIVALFGVEYCQLYRPRPVQWLWARRGFRWGAYAAGFYAIVFFGVFERVQFIYFQF